MGDYTDALGVDELEAGNMQAVEVGVKKVLVARIGDEYYAADNACPHLKGSLADGRLEGSVVTCPRHGSQFDLRDGHVVRWTDWSRAKLSVAKALKSPRPLKMYETKVEGGRVLVAVD